MSPPLLLLLLSIFPSFSLSLLVHSVQTSSFTIGTGQSDETVQVFTALPANSGAADWSTGAILDVMYRHREGSPGSASISFTPVNETHVRFVRDMGASNAVVAYVQQIRLAESSDASVTRWRGAFVDVPAARPGVSNGDLSILFASVDQSGTTWGDDDQPLFEFNATSIAMHGGSVNEDFSLQWLQLPGASGTEYLFSDNKGSDGHGDTDFPVSVGTNIDWSRSIVRYTSLNNQDTAPREWLFAISSFDTQGVTFEREWSNNGDTRIAGQIVQFDDGTQVQHVRQAFGDGNTGRTFTLDTAVPADNTIVLPHNIIGRSADSRQDNEDNVWTSSYVAFLNGCSVTAGVNMCSQVRFQRTSSSTGDAAFVATVQVVTFVTPTAAPTPSPTQSPTPLPTQSPTPLPTPAPTTPYPTASPTSLADVTDPPQSTTTTTTTTASTSTSTSSADGAPSSTTAPGGGNTNTMGTVDVGEPETNAVEDEAGEGGNNILPIIIALVAVVLLCVLLGVFVLRKRRQHAKASMSGRVGPAVPVGPVGPTASARPPPPGATEAQGEYGSIAALREGGGTYDTADSALDRTSYGTVAVPVPEGSAYSTVDQVRTEQITYGTLPNVQSSDQGGLYAAAPKQ
jgi:hypothetical protein